MPGELPKDAEEAKQGLFAYAKAWGGKTSSISTFLMSYVLTEFSFRKSSPCNPPRHSNIRSTYAPFPNYPHALPADLSLLFLPERSGL